MLTDNQKLAALRLLESRPQTIPGTRVVVNGQQRADWYSEVREAMFVHSVTAAADVAAFCDIAGVPS